MRITCVINAVLLGKSPFVALYCPVRASVRIFGYGVDSLSVALERDGPLYQLVALVPHVYGVGTFVRSLIPAAVALIRGNIIEVVYRIGAKLRAYSRGVVAVFVKILSVRRAVTVIIVSGGACCPVCIFLIAVRGHTVALVGDDVIDYPGCHGLGGEYSFGIHPVVRIKRNASQGAIDRVLAVFRLEDNALAHVAVSSSSCFLFVLRIDDVIALFVDTVIYDRVFLTVAIWISGIDGLIIYIGCLLRIKGQGPGKNGRSYGYAGPGLYAFSPIIVCLLYRRVARSEIPVSTVGLDVIVDDFLHVVVEGIVLVDRPRAHRVIRESRIEDAYGLTRIELAGRLVVRIPAHIVDKPPGIIGRDPVGPASYDVLEPVICRDIIYSSVLEESRDRIGLEHGKGVLGVICLRREHDFCQAGLAVITHNGFLAPRIICPHPLRSAEHQVFLGVIGLSVIDGPLLGVARNNGAGHVIRGRVPEVICHSVIKRGGFSDTFVAINGRYSQRTAFKDIVIVIVRNNVIVDLIVRVGAVGIVLEISVGRIHASYGMVALGVRVVDPAVLVVI